ncbi:MAG TPA: MotA/TolQ/ExbB proton channel family protein [Polyangia bacterium]|jgi:biopolymer transport protein ExbB/biopolymer transport protein TolQ
MLVQKLLSIAQVSGQAVLYILLALSVISIGIILERLVYFARRKIDAAAVGRKVVDYLREDDIEGARNYLSTLPGIEAEVIRDALGWYADGADAVAEVIAGGTKERRKGYESGLLFLGTLGNNAPFVGLFGTVLGIVTAFKELAGAAGSSAGMNNVMSGIAEALVATAVGILVALPAVIAYNAFQKKSQDLEENTMSIGNLVMAQMKSVKREAA